MLASANSPLFLRFLLQTSSTSSCPGATKSTLLTLLARRRLPSASASDGLSTRFSCQPKPARKVEWANFESARLCRGADVASLLRRQSILVDSLALVFSQSRTQQQWTSTSALPIVRSLWTDRRQRQQFVAPLACGRPVRLRQPSCTKWKSSIDLCLCFSTVGFFSFLVGSVCVLASQA